MTTTWTRKWLDADAFNGSQKSFTIYNNQMVFHDPGPAVGDAQIIATSDGETFASILDIDSAVSGIDGQGDTSGASLVVYKGNLFISQATGPGTTDARVLEWDGSSLAQHLNSVSQNNLWSYSLIVWGRFLWLITDQTPGVGNERRVVYKYDGSTWTAIIDYDGAAYLNYNVGAGLPATDIRHRTSKLFVYANRLYLLATRYNSGTAQWNWQSWVLNTNGTEFNKLADIDAGYVFSSVANFEGTLYIISNTISAGGNPQDPAKVYTTTDMTTFSLLETIASLGFPFGEQVFKQKLFVNVLDDATNNSEIWFINRFAGSFTLDATITTNTSGTQSGDLIEFKDGLYEGKWKEAYKRGAVVSTDVVPPDPGEIIVIKTRWKTPAGATVFKYYAPIDVRTPDIFYDGRLLGISGISRAIDDKTGMFTVGDITLDLANNDKEFSKLLATHFVKNQLIEVYHGWQSEAHGELSLITRMIVEDYSIHGPLFKLRCKDASQAYFKKKVPFFIVAEDEFVNIDPDAIGLPAPEVLGLNSITTGDAPGAVEAVYTDTVAFEYLAAYGTLDSITQVYSSNTLQGTPADYSVVFAGGFTYINFTSDQGDNKITFNCTGYAVPGWNSANGYVQNPAYIILYFLNQIMEVPAVSINYDSFDELANLYEDLGVGESGRLVLDTQRNPENVLREMLFSFGCVLFMDNSGRFVAKRKDISNFATSTYIFEQIDLLRPANRTYGLKDTINYAKVKWDYYNAPSIWKGAKESLRQPSIDDFETEMEPKTDWLYPWLITEAFVDTLVEEGLLKFSYGDKKLKFTLPIHWIDDLDIFDNFRYQDPWGISVTGAGEAGRYYYVESLNYDLQNDKIDIVAIDLQWLLQQYFILGDEDALASNWSTAPEGDKLYGYLCDETTGLFANGEAGKILIDENVLG